jgi:hypothetical protein
MEKGGVEGETHRGGWGAKQKKKQRGRGGQKKKVRVNVCVIITGGVLNGGVQGK